jgi:hypothetical protein
MWLTLRKPARWDKAGAANQQSRRVDRSGPPGFTLRRFFFHNFFIMIWEAKTVPSVLRPSSVRTTGGGYFIAESSSLAAAIRGG